MNDMRVAAAATDTQSKKKKGKNKFVSTSGLSLGFK
jgi:hypothetical protein